jgi:hypothetical protein
VPEATTTVHGLNIRNGGLTATTVQVIVKSVFKAGPPQQNVDRVNVNDAPPKPPYVNLMIDGQNYSNVTLEAPLANDVGKKPKPADVAAVLAARRPGKHHTRGPKAFTTLADDTNSLLKLQHVNTPADRSFGFVDAPFGRVYFAEWIEQEDRQITAGLRVVLTGDVEGEIVIADPGWNGGFYP